MYKLIEDTNIPALQFYDENMNIVNEEPDRLFLRRMKIEPDSYIPAPGENDITSIVNWSKFSTLREKDDIYEYNRYKDEFNKKAGATDAEKLANCTEEEKLIVVSDHVIKDQSLRLTVVTLEEDQANFYKLADESVRSRNSRIQAATAHIGYSLSIPDRLDLFETVDPYIITYVNTGSGDLSDYMNSSGAFVGSGFDQKPYYSAALVAAFNEIVNEGNY